MTQQFHYDEQIRRFLLQFTRMFSGFQVQYGKTNTGDPTYITVPVRYGDASRQAQTIIQQNSANSLPAAPIMTFYITSLDYARDRLQEPYHVNKINVRQRTWDSGTETYETTQGNAFTIERLMPAPYNLIVQLDIWTTNTNQKLQILEQILWLFNPSMEIQSTDNYIDWTSLSVVNLDSVNWRSRTIPQGTEDQIDIASLKFSMPIWISPPAKVKKLGVVERIIAAVYDSYGDPLLAIQDNDLLLGTRQKITPYGYETLLLNNQVQILPKSTPSEEEDISEVPTPYYASNLKWHTVIDLYGTLRPGISQLRFENSDGTEIVGTIAFNPADDRFMLFTVDEDTLPENTMLPVNAIIDPQRSGPGSGLPAAASGQRYLILNDIGNDNNEDEYSALAWRGTNGQQLVAKANDVIEFDGTRWQIVFDSREPLGVQYVTNITTSVQYKWNGESWAKSYEGLYPGGTWSLVL